MKLVSVIIPCYNCELYVEEAVRSIMNQTYKNLEILVINDGSTDKTEDILLKLSKEDSRVKYIKNEENIRLIKTLNKGLSLANGEYIVRMDADDISLPTRIEKQVAFLEKNSSVAVLGTSIRCFGEGVKQHISYQPLSDKEIRSKMFVASPFHHPTVIFNMNIIKKDDLFYDSIYYRAEDYGLWGELMKNDKYVFANLEEPLLNYRVLSTSETSLSNKNLELKNKVLFDIYKSLFGFYNYQIEDKQLWQYVYAVNRDNFSMINLDKLVSVYNKILAKNGGKLNLKKFFAVRCFAISVVRPKVILSLSINTIGTFTKYFFIGALSYIKQK